MDADKPAQTVIAPFATLLTSFLWLETWVEIASKGARQSPDDLSKLYLAIMAAYAGASEITKWLNGGPTIPSEDPAFERVQRGGFFIGLWLIPLLFAYTWRITNADVPMPAPLEKIVMGLVGIFFLKAASRKWRHKKNGVMDPITGEVRRDNAEPEVDFSEVVFQRIQAAPDGLMIGELFAAFPDVSRPRLYRALDKLLIARRVTRTGKPRTPDVRYRVVPR